MRAIPRIVLWLVLPSFFLLATTFSSHAVEVGDKAPDFELDSTKGGKVKLSSLRGKHVLINFYTLDFDPTWAKQLQASGSDENYAKFQAENTEVLGIAAATMFAQKAFADYFKIDSPLLSGGRDVTRVHKVLKDYGVLREDRLTANRSYFIIDKEGIVRYKNIRPSGSEKDLLPTETLLNEAKKINQGSWYRA